MRDILKIAVQKSGRLSEGTIELLKNCGIKITESKNKLIGISTDFPVELVFTRDDDIPMYVEDYITDIGIVGENVWIEKTSNTEIVEKLGFASCRLSVAIPKHIEYTGIEIINGKKIATTYPNIFKKFLNEHNLDCEIHKISGSTEIAPHLDNSIFGICDLVSSGSTLFYNGLKEVEKVFYSEAVLIKNRELEKGKEQILQKLQKRIQAVLKAKKLRYIAFNLPTNSIENVCKIVEGLKSPTVIPLVEDGWSALHVVVDENNFWSFIESLKENGAQGILMMPIEKVIE